MIVFISHGVAKEDAKGIAFLKRLFRSLNSELNLEPFLDMERLEEGYEWRTALHENLARCGAGVLVLSKRAIERDWVKKEATILSWRRALPVNPRFRLHVVMFEDVKDDELKSQGLGPLQLPEIQAWPCKHPEDLEQAVEGIRNNLKDLSNSVSCIREWTPLDKLRTYLEERLSALALTDLKNLANDMLEDDGDSLGFTGFDPEHKRLWADQIAGALLRNHFGKIGSLWEFMGRLAVPHLPMGNRRQIFDAVAPLWVEPQFAAKFHPQLDPLQSDGKALTVLADIRPIRENYAIDTLVFRAIPRPLSPIVLHLTPPEGLTDEILTRKIGEEIVSEAKTRNKKSTNSFTDKEILEMSLAGKNPVYLFLNFKIDVERVEMLRERFRGAIFILAGQSIYEEDDGGLEWRRVEGLCNVDFASKAQEYFDIEQSYEL